MFSQRIKATPIISEAEAVICRNLMAKDEFKNLGFADEELPEPKQTGEETHETEKTELKW